MSWTNTGGGDHEGAAWTPADTTVISGVHYNISTFTGTNGETLNINTGTKLEIYANTITILGTIDGNSDGEAGGATGGAGGSGASGSGAGAGGGGGDGDGGGGAGYGGVGGAGDGPGGAGGSTYDPTTLTAISMGSGGGGGGNVGGAGGRGGGGILLSANTVTVSGTITLNGANGGNAPAGFRGGGGGGSGGGIMMVGCTVDISNCTLSANGGNGGTVGPGNLGGGGGGGRVKIYYRTLTTTGSTITVAVGTGAGAPGAGSNFNDEMAQCTSTLEFGQTFTPGITGKVAISSVVLWVLSVATSGDFTLTVYDDSGKGTNYGSKSITVSGTGENTWTFDAWIELPDGTAQYYMELVADAGGDIDLGVYGNEPISGEDYYFNSGLLEKFSAYFKVSGIGHIDTPQVYNTADTTVKSNIANEILIDAIHRINTDGTGTIDYNDDFTTDKWLIDSTYSGVTHDTGNDELDIADDGYIYWKKDTKFPINGTPTLTSRINITAGTPTIQISEDAATWYDIDTAIADDVETIYPLDSDGNLSLAGKTVFYWRFDCVKAAPATASIKSFELDINIHTIYAKNPVISKGATASTFRCDQDADSGLACEVELIYPNRWWA